MKNTLFVLVVLCLIGCGGQKRPSDLPKLFPTSITITQEGVPLENALVTMFSSDEGFKWSVAAITDASGKAAIMTHGLHAGAPEGDFKVVVTKTESSNAGANTKVDPDAPSAGQATSETLYNLVEKQYMDKDTTPITISVAKGKNVQTYDIGKAVREKGVTVAF